MNTFEVIAFNASGDMLWLNGTDLDSEQTVTITGARNVQSYAENLKTAPRYSPEVGRFTRNRVALVIIRVSSHHEEAWARTGDGRLVRVTPEGEVVENGMGRSPEDITLGVGVRRVLAATLPLRRRITTPTIPATKESAPMNVALTPNRVETFTRPEAYGTPQYFGKVEWFDVVDRDTNALLPWTVSRVDGKECVINHPSEGVTAGFTSLRATAEVIHARRMR